MPDYIFNLTRKDEFIIVTLKDVAKTCGVSVSTASRAFDKTSRISQPIRQKILTCAEELGYTPNLIARGLKSRRTMTVALIVPSIENRFYIDVLKYMEVALYQHGYRLMVNFVQAGIITERDCLETAFSAQADAIVILPQDTTNQQFIDKLEEHIEIIQLFNAPYSQIDSVTMDDEGGTEAGTDYLITRGHRRILFAGGEDRINGFWRAVDRAKIPREELLVLPRSLTVEQMCRELCAYRPTAIFSVANSNEIVWQAIHELKLSIPDDISMIAYDNTNWIRMVGITAVAHDLAKISDSVVTQLMRRLNGSDSGGPKHLILDPYIVERKSVRTIGGVEQGGNFSGDWSMLVFDQPPVY